MSFHISRSVSVLRNRLTLNACTCSEAVYFAVVSLERAAAITLLSEEVGIEVYQINDLEAVDKALKPAGTELQAA